MHKDIAIVGMAGRFPDAANLDQLVENLKNGKDSVRDISPKRIKDTTLHPDRKYRACGYLEDIDKFDFKFFQISPAEARDMGPDQRLLLEVVHEAIDNAGVSIDRLSGTDTAVFVSESQTEYYQHADAFSDTLLTGNSADYLAAKIARSFNLQGSATLVNTSCSSSMVAIYYACNELILGNTEDALVCGVNLTLFPYKDAPGLDLESPDGRSMAFSANANGMSLGEMAAAIWLKPLDKAIADKNIIHAVIKGIAVNNNGNRSPSPTAPDSLMQAKLIRETWQKAGVAPTDIGFIEAHGSGTMLGDSLEVEGLDLAFEEYLNKDGFSKVPISTIKSNIGHGRSVSGLCGLIKTALCLKHRILFPTIHFEEPNPMIDFKNSAIYVNDTLQRWEIAEGKARIAGVSSIGASGINCHAVLTEAPANAVNGSTTQYMDNDKQHFITLSSKTPEGLINNLKALKRKLDHQTQNPLYVQDISYTLNQGRKHYRYRFACVVRGLPGLLRQLEEAAARGRNDAPPLPDLHRLIFIFSDHQDISPDLVNHFCDNYETFNQTYNQCRELCPDSGDTDPRFSNFAFQYSFFKLLEAYGILTDNVLGIGIGRILHQVISKHLTLAEAIKQVFSYKTETIENLETRIRALLERETSDSPAAFIEMGPSGILSVGLRKQQARRGNNRFYIFDPLRQNPSPDYSPLLHLLTSLYLSNYDIDWEAYARFHGGRRIELPAYQFQKSRCWLRDTHRPKPSEQPAAATEEMLPLLKEEANHTEQIIAGFWAEVLEIPQFSLDDDFFEIGGESLKATSVIKLINNYFPQKLNFEDIFDFPTIRRLSQYISESWTTEQKMAMIWQAVLKYDEIKPEDDFFRLGGHSLMANQVLNKIKTEFHLTLDFEDFFKYPTLKALSQYVDDRKAWKTQQPSEHGKIPKVEKKEYYPLSSAQKRMYLLQQIDPQSTAYNTPEIFEIQTQLDQNRIEKALQQLVERQESLRTSFEMVNDQPVQKVHPTAESRLNIRYLEADKDQVDRMAGDFIQPFDLNTAPLMRIGIIKMKEAGYLVMVDQHHIISDHASTLIFWREFMQLYEGKQLPPLPVQYKDFAEWQNSLFINRRLEKQESYWLKRFAGELPVLNLPIDYTRPALKSSNGYIVKFEIPENDVSLLRKIAREQEVTLYMILVAITSLFLAKTGNQEDIAVGAAIIGRRRAELERIIGMFVNTLVLRSNPAHDKPFTTFLKEIKAETLAAFENQDYPFEELVDKLGVNRDTSRNPIFDVMVLFEDVEGGALKNKQETSENAGHEYYFAENSTVPFDMTFRAIQDGKNLHISLEYCSALFKKETIANFINYFKNIIADLSLNYLGKISEIELIPEKEKKRILTAANNTKTEYPRDKTIHELFEAQVEQTPDNTALILHEDILTYHRLNSKANRLAGILRQKGVGPDQLTGLMTERSMEMIIAMLAILKAGGAYLPITPDSPGDRVNYLLKDSNSKLFLTQQEYIGTNAYEAEVLDLNDDSLYTGADDNPVSVNTPEDLAYAIYTSGSTGKPKGVLIQHRSVVNLAFSQKKNFEILETDNVLQFSSTGFDASVEQIYITLFSGATLVLVDTATLLDLNKFEECIDRYALTHIHGVPSYVGNIPVRKYKSLKRMIAGGDVCPLELLRKWTNYCDFCNEYGPTETTVTSIQLLAKKGRGISGISIGKPLDNTLTYVLDQFLRPVPIGVPGELYIGGDGVGRGYMNRPELTSRTFIKNPFRENERMYKTGDLVRWQTDGNMDFLGRIDNQVKIRGYRIELGEIENQLMTHQDIRETVVMAKEDRGREKYLCAYIVLKNNDSFNNGGSLAAELQTHLANKLPPYMIPAHFVSLDKIPLNPNGKIDTSRLPAPHIGSSKQYTPPETAIERALVELWLELLPLAENSRTENSLSIDDNFFELGGHSLNAMVLTSRIHKVLNVKVPLTEIFRTPTIRHLAGYIENQRKNRHSERHISIEAVEEKEYYTLSSAQKRLFLHHRMHPGSMAYNLPQTIPLADDTDLVRLRDAFNRLIERHESIRTSFHMVADQPVQKVHPAHDIQFNIQSRETGATDAFVRPFDLSQAPLLRVQILKTGTGENMLMVDIHHIISDGVSSVILKRDFSMLYEGRELTPLALQYKDYAQWQNKQKQRDDFRRQEKYWLGRFEGGVPELKIPADFERDTGKSSVAGLRCFVIGGEDAEILRQIALEEGATLYMVMVALYNILLSLVGNQQDIVIGVPTANRGHSDLEHIMGMFVNMLVLRNFPKPELRFTDFLKDVKQSTLEAYENQDYPFDDLVAKLVVDRNLNRNQLFDYVFTFESYGPGTRRQSTPETTSLLPPPPEQVKRASPFDLNIFAEEIGKNVFFTLEYDATLFETSSIDQLATYYIAIAEQIIKDKHIKLKDIFLPHGLVAVDIIVDESDDFGFND